MNVEYFIAKKLFTAKEENNSYTKPILRIAILAIALSISVMLISIMVVTGFKKDISSKIVGFGSHITLTSFFTSQSYSTQPINTDKNLYDYLSKNDDINGFSAFATKSGIIKTNDEIHGVLLKGVDSDYNWTFFNEHLIDGKVLDLSDPNAKASKDILISEQTSKLLNLYVSDKLRVYFVPDNFEGMIPKTRVRDFNILGIYNTDMVDFDELYILGDIKHVRNLNSWGDNQVGGIEVVLNDFDNLDKITQDIDENTSPLLKVSNVRDRTPQIFDWLDLQDVNARVILILMLIVGVINMVTVLLIIILERTYFIGVLKSFGATNWSVRKIFIYIATNLVLKGLFIGNIIAFVFAFLQYKYSIISLDPQTYYMDTVPVNFDFYQIFMINFGTLVICFLILIIPSFVITKIMPVKAIKFE